MSITEQIEFLKSLGYEITPPADSNIAASFYKYGEEWENNPKEYAKIIEGKRAEYIEALDSLNYDFLVSDWETDTLRSVVEWGSDIALSKEQRKAMRIACAAEIINRNPITKRFFNGM